MPVRVADGTRCPVRGGVVTIISDVRDAGGNGRDIPRSVVVATSLVNAGAGWELVVAAAGNMGEPHRCKLMSDGGRQW